MQLIIPMSGFGNRFKDKGYAIPKPLIQISGRPMVHHVVDMFPDIEEILFIVNRTHFESAEIELEKVLNRISPKAQIAVIEPHKLGPAWAVHQAHKHINLDTPVVVNYCDFACIWDSASFREKMHSGIDGLIATYSGFHPHMLRNNQYAYLRVNQSYNLLEIQEKVPFTHEPMNEPASSGTYGFRSGQVLLDAVDKQIKSGDSYNGEFYMSLTYKNMIESRMLIKNFEIQKFFQWGTPEDFEDFKKQKDFFTFKQAQSQHVIPVNRIEILAAGEGKRFSDTKYTEIKPFLPVGESFLSLEAFAAIGTPLDSRAILLQENHVIPKQNLRMLEAGEILVHTVEALTKGQAESALIALSRKKTGSCIIGTCDSLVFPDPGDELPIRGKTIGVWLTKPNDFAKKHPEQFGWVSLEGNGQVKNLWVKEIPDVDEEVYVITGTFFFGDDAEGSELIKAFLLEGTMINNELYLDSVLAFARKNGWKVTGLFPEWFVSLGTPEEYETYRYWESVFYSRKDLLVNE
jgi:dTDP-glucose pyrophosphorylase